MKLLPLGGSAAGAFLAFAAHASAQFGSWADAPSPSSPPFRATEGLALEPASGLVVVYGGTGSSGSSVIFDETWVFDGCAWAQLFPSPNPGPRMNVYLAPSPTPGRVVLFGGGVAPGVVDGSTWEFDLATLSWTDATPPGASPSPRQLANLVYDSVRQRTVLFGGTNGGGGGFMNDTWEWDGSAWTDVTPAAANPVPRGWHAMAFDEARGRTVLFGGYNGAQLGDTWEWDGLQWTPVATPASPSPRSSGAIAYDPWSQRVVLFAGSTGWPVGLDDTWEYDGVTWTPVTIGSVVTPPPMYLHRMVGDPRRGGVLVYGAFGNSWASLSDAWRYHRATLLAVPPNPPAGTIVTYSLTLPSDAGFPYLAGISLSGTCPGLPLPDGRVLSINLDGFTSAALSGAYPAIFQGFIGLLSGGGTASFSLAIPPIAGLSGTAVDVAVITLNGFAFGSVTNPARAIVQ